MPPGSGVALLRLRSLGDIVLMTPGAAALKVWRQDLRFAAVIEARFAAALAGNPDFAEIIAIEPGPAGRWTTLRALRRFRPALVAGLHGGSSAALFARASGARWRANFLGLRNGWAYNRHAPPKPPPPGRARLHTVEHVASLFEALGLPQGPLGPLRVFPNAAARARLRQRLSERGITGRFAFLNTEARELAMRWPLDRYGELAAWLRRERGLASVQASAGPGRAANGAVLLTGTTVEDLIALIAEADLLVGSDGGPVHLAAALGKPMFVLYATTDLEVWHPWQARARWLQVEHLSAVGSGEVISELAALMSNQ
ncbi:MAG TPA: glycosyltransferase family 9 protein [Terriglobales bacterium]|nr:glycosyltransferase family 9 protein [Terriglobales bacterium]